MAGSAGSKYGIVGDGVPTAKGKVMNKIEPLKKSILDKDYIITMHDGSRWAVPVRVIAKNRAAFYADEFDSMVDDTVPFFEENGQAVIESWAKNNMNWEDVVSWAIKLPDKLGEVDFNEGWNNGKVEIE